MKTSTHHCHKKECRQYIDREISRYLCKQHEIERREFITKQMESLLENFDNA